MINTDKLKRWPLQVVKLEAGSLLLFVLPLLFNLFYVKISSRMITDQLYLWSD